MKRNTHHDKPVRTRLCAPTLAAIRGGTTVRSSGTAETRSGGGDDDPGTIVIIDRDGP